MTVTNQNQLVLNIDNKTRIFSSEQVKNALKDVYVKDIGSDYDIDKKGTTQLLKIYLAIPYTGMEESSYDQANKAASTILNSFKCNVFSPITHSHPIAKLGVKGTWDYWQYIDYQFIDWCDEVWVLIPEQGISKLFESEGVKAEIQYAKTHNKRIKYISIENEEIKLH
jgi:Domain of unknown function (DUF1937)